MDLFTNKKESDKEKDTEKMPEWASSLTTGTGSKIKFFVTEAPKLQWVEEEATILDATTQERNTSASYLLEDEFKVEVDLPGVARSPE